MLAFLFLNSFGENHLADHDEHLDTRPLLSTDEPLTPQQISKIRSDGTRQGSFALFIFSLTALIASIILPFLVTPLERDPSVATAATAAAAGANPQTDTTPTARSSKPQKWLSHLKSITQTRWRTVISLPRAWQAGLILAALCYISTFLISTPRAAYVMAGFMGIPWALTQWAPFTLLSVEVARLQALHAEQAADPGAGVSDLIFGSESRRAGQGAAGSSVRGRHDRYRWGSGDIVGEEILEEDEEDYEDSMGTVLGLHNVAVSAPQIVATLLASGILALANRKGPDADKARGMVWVLRASALGMLAAAWCARRVVGRPRVA